ncbi:elongation factor Ts, mitochondrial [Dendrobium catenatum]|uniref:Elongation factor Ts, mitochondrial n=1 Tax=Dendrobium catenatum TaxID=906689 RepID=A0A2I0WLF1_9ASPA|nr:elongation factor Ts, mitochondrial [Dendrobium catenatum]XP_028551869.1 elongation factor Ts, mitochondrial [Dendrobium catenatum]PKU76485.1 Elongation factor Ts, mitochondrial [Dendrobium catenatum]
MAGYWSAKSSIKFLVETNILGNIRQGYATWACRGNRLVRERDFPIPFSLNSSTIRWYSLEVSASEQLNLIKQLRERTSAPIKHVKSALVDCKWDIDAAQKDLRKKGVVLASKKSSRTAAEGLLAAAHSDNRAVIIELNCETDFVARNDVFQHLALAVARTALSRAGPVQEVQEAFHFGSEYMQNMNVDLSHPKLSGETTVQSAITEVASMVGENVKLRRGITLSTLSHGVVCSYLHSCPQPGLGRIAGMLTIEAEDSNASLESLRKVGSSLAMHIVAAKPLFLSREHVSSEAIESERDILKSQAESSGKSQIAMEKMVEGRLRKYFEEVVLLEQKFVMNDGINIKSLLDDLSKEVGSSVKIGSFTRIEVGEGIQRIEASD